MEGSNMVVVVVSREGWRKGTRVEFMVYGR